MSLVTTSTIFETMETEHFEWIAVNIIEILPDDANIFATMKIVKKEGDTSSLIYEGSIKDFIIPTTFYLNVESEATMQFHNRDEMDNYLRRLVASGYSIKTSISIIDEGKTGNFINQFCGEIWHYLDDWNNEMLPRNKKVLH